MSNSSQFATRPLAITDVETTGTDETVHEIVGIGLLVVEQDTLRVRHVMEAKVKPEHIETASEKALEINGYNPEDWKDAHDLETAMKMYAWLAKDAMLASWNYHFEKKFLEAACRKVGLDTSLGMDYHNRGIETYAAELLRDAVRLDRSEEELLTRENMKYVAEFLGVEPEPDPHNALEGAKCAFRVYSRLREITVSLGVRFSVDETGKLTVKGGTSGR